ncbi:MAG: hypothetical protein PUC18_00825 [Prevotellaceae bacterium]|nr:hypothetical protein [Prevotellaceae bacterium]
MKKEYIQPEMEIMVMETENMLIQSYGGLNGGQQLAPSMVDFEDDDISF